MHFAERYGLVVLTHCSANVRCPIMHPDRPTVIGDSRPFETALAISDVMRSSGEYSSPVGV